MMRRFLRDESGMVMGITVMVVLLVGVMGAGLLVFVRNDLEAVIEVNQGQKALELADAGVQAAKQQLYADPDDGSYDSDTAGNVEWAYVVASGTPGKTLSLDGGTITVTIQYLLPADSATVGDPNYAPEIYDPLAPRDYYRVLSEGIAGDARRKVEAILSAEEAKFPKTYFVTRDINVNGNAFTLTDVSMFAGRDILQLRRDSLKGRDIAYGNWQNAFNDKARSATDPTVTPNWPADAAGAAAEGTINYSPTDVHTDEKSDPNDDDRFRNVDFDGNTPTSSVAGYRFCREGTTCWPAGDLQPADVITHPFNPDTREISLAPLKEIAMQQGYYYSPAGGTTFRVDDTNYPESASDKGTVFYIEFSGGTRGTVDYKVTTMREGTLVVINGDVTTSSASAGYTGVLIMRDPNNFQDTGTPLQYSNGGSFSFTGYINIEGSASLRGSATPLLTEDVLERPGFFNIRQWSWRECYSQTCS